MAHSQAAAAHSGRTWLVLGAIAIVAAALRVAGLRYGLPAVYNPDEVAIMARALAFAKGSLNPHNFLYPTFYFYVLFAWVGAWLAFLYLSGRVGSIAELQRLYFTDPSGLYTAGRTLGVAAGTLTTLLVYRLGERIASRRAGVAAALFLATAPLGVLDSHYVKHDVFATMLVVLAYLAMVRVWPAARDGGPRTRDVAAAGAACGAAFSTHYYCVFLALPLAWCMIQSNRGQSWGRTVRDLLLAGGWAAAIFLALSPFIAVEPGAAWRDIVANRAIVVDRAVAAGAFAPALRYLDILIHDSMGVPVVVLGGIGVVWMLAAAPARAILLLAFPVSFFAFISNTVPASRYLNPVLPFLAVFAGWTLAEAAARRRVVPWVFWTAVVACAVPGALASVRTDRFIRQTDTRTLALDYIERTVPAGATVLVQPYSTPLTPSRQGLEEALTRHVGSPEAASTKFRLQLSVNPYPSPAYRVIYLGRGGLDVDKIYVDPAELGGARGLAPLRRLGVAFVVLKRYNRLDPEMRPFVDALGREARRIAVFSPYRPRVPESERARIDPFLHNTDARIDDALERPGPPLEIWQLDDPGS
ncbi:MAG: glycosyltransferase family 39 protein [Acidobacteriota bacterium]